MPFGSPFPVEAQVRDGPRQLQGWFRCPQPHAGASRLTLSPHWRIARVAASLGGCVAGARCQAPAPSALAPGSRELVPAIPRGPLELGCPSEIAPEGRWVLGGGGSLTSWVLLGGDGEGLGEVRGDGWGYRGGMQGGPR